MSDYSTATELDHQGVFVERYAAIRSWAMRLAKGDRDLVEDLVQDAYVQFVLTAPPLDEITNLDGYLFGLVRNLCLSHYRQSSKNRLSQLSVFDYDSAQDGLSTIDARDQEFAREELKQLCAYLAVRKDSTKSACIFVMRFLLGYFPSEIAAILRSSRAAVDVRMMSARNDLRSFLASPKKPQVDIVAEAARRIAKVMPVHEKVNQDEFLWLLRSTIFEFSIDSHKSRKDIEKLHKNADAEAVNIPWLSHLVSCPTCLDEVNTMFNFPKLSARFPTDALKRESKSNGDPGDDDPTGPNGSGADLEALARSEQRVREHKPKDINVSVNGVPHGSQLVNASTNRLKLNIPKSERLEFVEVFSEQCVRLMMVSIPEALPEGACIIREHVELSDGRHLSVDVEFTELGAEIRVAYVDPTFDEVIRLSNLLASEDSTTTQVDALPAQLEPTRNRTDMRPGLGFGWISDVLRLGWPRFAVAGAIALAVLGFWIYTDTGYSAKAILEEAEKRSITWEFEKGKVKHWVNEIETQGTPGRPDRKYLSYFWQNNIDGQGSRMIVHRNLEGKIEWGIWIKADGTFVQYGEGAKDKLVIYPNYAQLEASKAGLDEESRNAIDNYINYVKRYTDPKKLADGKLNYIRRFYDRGEISTEVRPNDGKVLVMRFRPMSSGAVSPLTSTFENVIEVRERDYMEIATVTTYYFEDGHFERTTARHLEYSESTQTEMENNEFTQFLSEWPNPKYVDLTDIIDRFKSFNR